jgi:hypothetical protein
VERDEVGRTGEAPWRAVTRDVGQKARQAARAGLGHVEMGIGAEDRDGGGQIDHGLREVGVEIEADRDGQVRADLCADEPQERPFAVEMLAR